MMNLQPVREVLPLECPFAWKTETFYSYQEIHFLPPGSNSLTMSFTVSRTSKVLGYIPFVGTIIGINRIARGIFEYRFFESLNLHELSGRSVKWVARGVIELFPVVGGITCIILDLIATWGMPNDTHPCVLFESKSSRDCPDCKV